MKITLVKCRPPKMTYDWQWGYAVVQINDDKWVDMFWNNTRGTRTYFKINGVWYYAKEPQLEEHRIFTCDRDLKLQGEKL